MHKPSEHRMLKHCLSIAARLNAEQCPTNATNELTHSFFLLKHQSLVSNARRGTARFDPLEGKSLGFGSR